MILSEDSWKELTCAWELFPLLDSLTKGFLAKFTMWLEIKYMFKIVLFSLRISLLIIFINYFIKSLLNTVFFLVSFGFFGINSWRIWFVLRWLCFPKKILCSFIELFLFGLGFILSVIYFINKISILLFFSN